MMARTTARSATPPTPGAEPALPGTLRRNKSLLNRFYEAMGYGATVGMTRDHSVINLATSGPTEFTEMSRQEGVSAALRWQKERFADVGAF